LGIFPAMFASLLPRFCPGSVRAVLVFILLGGGLSQNRAGDANGIPATSLSYTNIRTSQVPWSIHVVRASRKDPTLALQSMHAKAAAIGLGTLTEQVRLLSRTNGIPVAAINGDFYQRDQAYAGDPRGLQVMSGELLSGPSGGASFWLDGNNQPHLGEIVSDFEITWPDGNSTPFGLNGDRPARGIELYTPAAGPSTKTSGGRELVLENPVDANWLPLKISQSSAARVVQIREGGNTKLGPGQLVLSIPPALMNSLSAQTGQVLRISTACTPSLRGAHTALSAGPILLQGGRQLKIRAKGEGFQFSSMFERHPRSCIGWNEEAFFLVEVDGRQKGLSVGMTLDELGTLMMKLGCTEAMNLDGGGSATLWYRGKVRNSPCDGREREVANSLILVKKEEPAGVISSKTTN
jgi:hypothetical protein